MWVKGMLNESCPCCWQYWVAACLGVCPGDCGPLALPLPLVLKPGGSGKGKTGLVGSPPSGTPPFTWIVVVEVIHEPPWELQSDSLSYGSSSFIIPIDPSSFVTFLKHVKPKKSAKRTGLLRT